jgi:hypothetical protein
MSNTVDPIHDDIEITDQELNKINLTQFVNNLFAFIAAYILANLFYQIGTILAAGPFSMNGNWTYFDLDLYPSDGHWRKKAIVVVYSAGALTCASVAIVSIFIYFNFLMQRANVFKTIVVWLFLHCINASFGSVIIGSLFNIMNITNVYKGAGHALAWGNIRGVSQFVVMCFSVLLLAACGFFSYSLFIQSALSKRQLSGGTGARLKYITFAILLPYVIGTLFLFAMRMPHNEPYDFISFPLLGTAVLAACSLYGFNSSMFIAKALPRDQNVPSFALAGFAILLVLIFRIGLSFAIPF